MSPPELATALSHRLGDITGMITAVDSVAAYPLHAAISARFTAQSVAWSVMRPMLCIRWQARVSIWQLGIFVLSAIASNLLDIWVNPLAVH